MTTGRSSRRIPLSLAAPPCTGQATVPVAFVREHPPSYVPAAHGEGEVADVSVGFALTRRFHRIRRTWHTTEPLPANLYAPPPALNELTTYIH